MGADKAALEAKLAALQKELDGQRAAAAAAARETQQVRSQLTAAQGADKTAAIDAAVAQAVAAKEAELQTSVELAEAATTAAEQRAAKAEAKAAAAAQAVPPTPAKKSVKAAGTQTDTHADPVPAPSHAAEAPDEGDDLELSGEEATDEEEDEDDEALVPDVWSVPLPRIPRSSYFVVAFVLDKAVQSNLPGGRKLRRTWVVDFFKNAIHNVDAGKISKSFPGTALVLVERHVTHPLRLRLLFAGVGHDHDVYFLSPTARERFYELAQLLRRGVTSYAPELMNPANTKALCGKTTVDANGENSINVDILDAERRAIPSVGLKGTGAVDVSRRVHEHVKVWVGSHNLLCNAPAKGGSDEFGLGLWIPRGGCDIYAVTVQNCGVTADAFYDAIRQHLGPHVMTVATLETGDSALIVLARKTVFPKIANAEGSKVKTSADNHGLMGISLSVLDTSFCFLAASLPHDLDDDDRTSMLHNAIDSLQLANYDSDVVAQFTHTFCFGDFGYCLNKVDQTELSRLVAGGDFAGLVKQYDGLTATRHAKPDRVLRVFIEPRITFGPTAFTEHGPAYLARVLHTSPPAARIRNVSYEAADQLLTSEYLPVSATFVTEVLRPAQSLFAHRHEPVPEFTFAAMSVTLDGEWPVGKPSMSIVGPGFGVGPVVCDSAEKNTTSVEWTEGELKKFPCTSQVLLALEGKALLFILRDNDATGKKHRGTAVLSLEHRLVEKMDEQQSVTLPLLLHGGAVGRLKVTFSWDSSDVELTHGMVA